MGAKERNRYADDGKRLRLLRQALHFENANAFAVFLGWKHSGLSMFESGKRQVTVDKAIQLARKIPGFDPMWLWTGEKRGLSFDLARQIDAEEAKEQPPRPHDRR